MRLNPLLYTAMFIIGVLTGILYASAFRIVELDYANTTETRLDCKDVYDWYSYSDTLVLKYTDGVNNEYTQTIHK